MDYLKILLAHPNIIQSLIRERGMLCPYPQLTKLKKTELFVAIDYSHNKTIFDTNGSDLLANITKEYTVYVVTRNLLETAEKQIISQANEMSDEDTVSPRF